MIRKGKNLFCIGVLFAGALAVAPVCVDLAEAAMYDYGAGGGGGGGGTGGLGDNWSLGGSGTAGDTGTGGQGGTGGATAGAVPGAGPGTTGGAGSSGGSAGSGGTTNADGTNGAVLTQNVTGTNVDVLTVTSGGGGGGGGGSGGFNNASGSGGTYTPATGGLVGHAGGDGGVVNLTFAGQFVGSLTNAAHQLVVHGGDGGKGGDGGFANDASAGNGGSGGNGGNVELHINSTGNTMYAANVTGGNGGNQGTNNSATGGTGGTAGSGLLEVATGGALESHATNVTGGAGGTGLTAGTGGAATFTVNGLHTSGTGGLTITAGNAGTAVGGNALLDGSGTLTSYGNVLVRTNTASAAGSKAELLMIGLVKMEQDPLNPTNGFLNITANETSGLGNVKIDIATLEAAKSNVSLQPTNVNSQFHVSTINLSNGLNPTGQILRLENNYLGSTPLQFGVNTLNVLGKGRLQLDDGNLANISRLNAQGAGLSILSQTGAAPGTVIATVGSGDISGTALSIDDRNGRLGLTNTNQSLRLLSTGGLKSDIAHYRSLSYLGDKYSLEVWGNNVELTLTADAMKAYSEARAASLAFVNQGSDLLMNQGFGSAIGVTAGSGWRIGAFGTMSGGWSEYGTGSHVDVSGLSMLAGLAVGNDVGPGRLTAGVFFEGGWGSYNTFNDLPNGDVEGDGNTDYYGGGLLARYDVTSGVLDGLYTDFAARVGNASTDFNSSDIKYTSSVPNGFLGDADFDTDSLYYGLMAGVGYKWDISEAAQFDLSAHLLWTHQEGDSVDVYFDDLDFGDAESLRTRVGGRFNYAVSEHFTPYAGAYWEYEFDGEVNGKINGWRIDEPSLQGSTGVGELGFTVKPVADGGLSIDLGVQGYTGIREGVTGSLGMKFEF